MEKYHSIIAAYKSMYNENSVNESMPTGNEAGMMFRVSVEGLPDMIMVGKSPGDIKILAVNLAYSITLYTLLISL